MPVKKRILISVLLPLLAICNAKAQFYLAGDDPGSLKWQYIRTPNYKVIYPRGLDSLATVYAKALETNRPKVGMSAGYLPGEKYWGTTPVVLHPYTGYANGSVAWAPMRVDLYTLPDAYSPETLSWVNELSIHENRHIAQLQFGADGVLRPFNWLFGEAATGAFAGIFPNYWMTEGDAVATETALSKAGRGRSSDFMAYYATAFDRGDMRNWEKWLWGSWRRYAPNHYALGYMTVAGARYMYSDPLFTSDYLRLAAARPLKLSKVRSWFKTHSGKSFGDAFGDIMQMFKDTWEADAAARGPFMPLETTAPVPKWYTTYSSLAFGPDGSLYAVKSSFVRAPELIRVLPSGKEEKVRAFASAASSLVSDGECLLWTETVADRRWSLAATSVLRSLENGRVKDLSSGKHRYYNPAIGPQGAVSLTEYPFEGGSAIVVLDKDGSVTRNIKAPDGVQFVESAWIGDSLFLTLIGEDGFGLARVTGIGGLESLIQEGPEKINHLKSFGGLLYFISDRGGVGEVYSFSPENQSLTRITNTRFGVTDFAFNGETLYFAARQYEGDLLCKADAGGLKPEAASAREYYKYAVADTLSAQEKRLADAAGIDLSGKWDGEISAPKSYNKLLNAIRIHSWVPLGINYDEVASLSDDKTYNNLNLGATVVFQNTLGSLYGTASYMYRAINRSAEKPKNAFFLDFTYTGLYPVIQAKLHIGERQAIQYYRQIITTEEISMESVGGTYLDMPLAEGEVKVYLPLNFSKGGWSRGFIPQLRFIATNDRYNKGAAIISSDVRDAGEFRQVQQFAGSIDGKNALMQSFYASLRAYSMRPVAHSGVYPSLGIGAELGYHQRLSLTNFYSPQIYGYLYGYLPGLLPQQGLRLTALGQVQLDANRMENAVSTNPRGLDNGAVDRFLANNGKYQLRLTADYGIPFWLGDISALSPLTYIKNFVLTPHFDYAWFKAGGGRSGALLSTGASFTAKLANILWFPFDSEVGITFSYNGGRSYDRITALGYSLDRTYTGFIFKTSI